MQCAACSALTEEQWSHLRENFAKRSAYRQRTGSQGDPFEEPETEDPAQTGEDLSRVDGTLLDLEPEETGTGAPLAGISPLTSLPAPLPAQNVPATSLTMGAVNQPMAPSPALFRAPHPIFVKLLYTIGSFLKILEKFFVVLCMEIIFSYIRLPIS